MEKKSIIISNNILLLALNSPIFIKGSENTLQAILLSFSSIYFLLFLPFNTHFKHQYQYYKLLMPRGKKQEKKLCTAHTFSIKPKEIHACYYQQSISIKFCRIGSNQGTSSAKTIGNCYEGPTFNKDQNFSTPCFVLASDKASYLQNASKSKQENEKKIIHYNEQKSEMLFPKPNSKNMYCSVCKDRYEDYRNHIRSEKHKKTINLHPFNRHILQLQAKYKEKRKNIPQSRHKDIVQTTDYFDRVIVIPSAEEECENQIYGAPRKLRKFEQKPIYPNTEYMPIHGPPPMPFMRNQCCQPPLLYPNFYQNMPFSLHQQCMNNTMFPFSFQFPQYIQPGIFNGILGGYNEGFPHNRYPGFTYGVPEGGFGSGGIRADKSDKEKYIVVDDDQL